MKDIVRELRDADVVVADLTDRNANVFYELGIRHSLKNRTVLIAQNIEDVPSDLRQYGIIVYGRGPGEITRFKAEMRNQLRATLGTAERSDNPVSDFLRDTEAGLFHFERIQTVRKLDALTSELSHNISYCEALTRLISKARDGRRSVPSVRLRADALSQLLATNYALFDDSRQLRLLHLLYADTVQVNVRLEFWMLLRQDTKDAALRDLEARLQRCRNKAVTALSYVGQAKRYYQTLSSPDTRPSIVVLADESHESFLGE
ncbi:MAG: hypothetical protein M0Z66_16665 [Thermaerobacter sp.]|nr:hypothetical protein [Thermaerobacter sp.]